MDLYLPIIGSKIISENNDVIQYLFIPDGTYGAFNCLIYDHAKPHFEMKTVNSATKLINSILWGQTCDSFDIVYVDLSWPHLTDGDLIRISNFGAYTYSPTSFFKGFVHHKVFVIDDENDDKDDEIINK
jgi:ornithine decarboxylase